MHNNGQEKRNLKHKCKKCATVCETTVYNVFVASMVPFRLQLEWWIWWTQKLVKWSVASSTLAMQ